MALTQPALIPQPWGSDGQVGNIPQDSSEFGKASWAKGFPTETAQSLTEGGIPPRYLDFQGVLNALSSHAVFMQSGAHYAWSNTLDYPVGCFVLGSDGKLYQALQASGPGYSAGAKNPTTNGSYWKVANFAEYLPLSGGTMTGPIKRTGALVELLNPAGAVSILGGQASDETHSGIHIYGQSHPTEPGSVQLISAKEGARTDAILRPDSMTVGGKHVVCSVNGVNANAAGEVTLPNLKNGAAQIVVSNAGLPIYVDSTGKSREMLTVANLSWPGAKVDDLTLGANGTTYTAPADGYYSIYATMASAPGASRVVFYVNQNKLVSSIVGTSTTMGMFIPIKKGQTMTVYQTGGAVTVNSFVFIYAEGANYA